MALDQPVPAPPPGRPTRSLATRSVAMLAGRILQEASKAIIFLWLARRDQAGYGLITVAGALVVMTRALLSEGLDQFILREIALDFQSRHRLLASLLRLKAGLGGLILAGLASWGWWAGWSGEKAAVLGLAVLGQVLDGLAEACFTLLRLQGRQVQEATWTALANLCGLVYGLIVLAWGGGVAVLVGFMVLGSGLRLALAALAVRPSARPEPGPAGLSLTHLRGMLNFVGVAWLGSFYNQVQALLLNLHLPPGRVALYGAASDVCGSLLQLLLVSLVVGVFYPSLARSLVEEPARLAARLRTLLLVLLAVGLGLAAGLIFFGQRLVGLLYGPAYLGARPALIWLAVAMPLSLVNNLLIHALWLKGRERILLGLHLVPAALGLLAGMDLIPRLGEAGAALAVLISRSVLAVLLFGVAQGEFGLFRGSIKGRPERR